MKHDYKISLIRCFAMCSIIFCHFLQYFGNGLAFWFNVGVQVFLFMSGYLYGARDKLTKGFVEKNSIKILLDFWIYLIIIIPIYYIFCPDVFDGLNIVNLFLCKGTVSGIEHLWFIPCILFCYLITPILYCSRKKWLEYTSKQLLVVFLLYLLIGRQLIKIYTNQSDAWVLCYILGYFYGFLIKTKDKNAKAYNIFCVGIVIIGSLLFLFRIGNECFWNIVDTNIYWYSNLIFYTHVMLGASIFIILITLLRRLELRENKILTFSDKYSYDIYLVHHIYIQGVLNIEEIVEFRLLNITLIIVIILISGVALKTISDRVISIISNIKFVKS